MAAEAATPPGQGRGNLSARIGAALLLTLSLAAAVQAHLDERAASARAYLTEASTAAGEDRRVQAKSEAASELNQWSGTGELRDLAALLALTEPDAVPAEAVDWAKAALRRNPANGETWARLAFALTAMEGAIGEEAADALSNSFVVTPYGPHLLLQARLEFTLTHWNEVSTSDQRSALRQVPPLLENTESQAWLNDLRNRITDPDARQALENAIGDDAP